MHKIGRYEIERELGRGAMGIVYLARDTRLGRSVALKTIRLGDFADAEKLQRLRERLIREAQSAGSLSHENIVTIYDVDELDEISYISMEFVEGDSLERMLERRRELSREALLGMLRQIASGLDFAHSRGIVHRDIKPPNVMVTPLGRVKITDFGVAKVTYATSMTQGGAMLGTPDYMSPEQIDGRGVNGRADQFSLGVIAFELLTGEKPFIADSLAALFYRIAHEPAPDAALLNPSLGADVGAVLARATAKRPEDRYPTCMAFVDELIDSCGRSIGWHALPRGMSHTLPTAHEGPSIPPPVVLPTLASPQSSDAITRPLPVPVYPKARQLPPLGGGPPPPEAGFITAVPAQGDGSVSDEPVQDSQWLQRLEEEERMSRSSGRRTIMLVLLGFLLLGGGLVGAYYWMEGGPFLRSETQVAQDTELGGQSPGLEQSTVPDGSADSPYTSEASDSGPGTSDESVDGADASGSGATAEDTPVPEPGDSTPASEGTASDAPPTAPTPAVDTPKQAPRTVSPPRERLATVRFMTEPPGARVTVDAMPNLSCESPCSLEIPVGRHTYSVRMGGYRNEIRAFEVSNYGSTVNLKLQRATGMVRVTSTPIGATVTVNGERQSGTTPITLRLVPGNYRIAIERDGRSVERNVNVREDAIVQLSASLDP